MTWGHTVSKNMIDWFPLPFALKPETPLDIKGVYTGSITLLPDGRIIMLYTGDTENDIQVQNLAYPADLSDPLLVHWVRYHNNPVIEPPPGVGDRFFHDPTTAWQVRDGTWQIAIGTQISGTGMWECVDFFPISTTEECGLDTSFNGPGVEHVLKVSIQNEQKEFYAIGSYDARTGRWIPDNPEMDLGVGLRLDYGKCYAIKTFYDPVKQRRISWAWIEETDSKQNDLSESKGWASAQGIPRTIVFDKGTRNSLLQWPIEEVEQQRLNSTQFDRDKLSPGSLVPLHVSSTAEQLDISATFEVDWKALGRKIEPEPNVYNCTTGGDSARGALGPFGLNFYFPHLCYISVHQ